MKKFLLFLLLATLSLAANAQSQQLRFGYFSYREAFETMPGYAVMQRNLNDLKNKYDAETKATSVPILKNAVLLQKNGKPNQRIRSCFLG